MGAQERVPLQYLVGAAHWRDLVLAVGPGVLIPRPETELIIDFVEEELRGSPSLAAAPWADLGCGSGVNHSHDGLAATLRRWV
jgi:release factor glutamine methyltransferase